MIKELTENIEQLFNDYTEMQNHHYTELLENPEADIKKQNFERSKSFEALKNSLRDVLRYIKANQNEENIETAVFCQKRIKMILEKDKAISEKITEIRSNLKKQMVRMTTGKKVLNAYKQGASYR